jgi:hypothetical protein
MTSGFGSVGSVLTERPPSDGSRPSRTVPAIVPASPARAATGPQPVVPSLLAEPPARPPATRPAPARGPISGHPHPAQPAQPAQPILTRPAPSSAPSGGPAGSAQQAGNRTWYDSLLSGRQYEVVYDDAAGYPLIAFADGQWFDVTSFNPQPVTVRHAMRLDPAWAGAIVQTVCMWMRGNPNHDRSFELATELALAVGELARLASD